MSGNGKLTLPPNRRISRAELEENCGMYVNWIAKSTGLYGDVGFVLTLFPKDSAELGVSGSNVTDLELVEKVLDKASKRVRRQRIVRPL